VRRGDELTVIWMDRSRRPDDLVEREAARLAGILGADLRFRFTT